MDWKVEATIDREKMVEEIVQLLNILKRQKIYCIISAEDEAGAREEAMRRLEQHMGIPGRFVRSLHPRRLR